MQTQNIVQERLSKYYNFTISYWTYYKLLKLLVIISVQTASFLNIKASQAVEAGIPGGVSSFHISKHQFHKKISVVVGNHEQQL